jgi:hypothetical protein
MRWKTGRFSFIYRVEQSTYKEGKTPMRIEVSVPEVVSLFKQIQTQPEQLFDLIRTDIRHSVGQYLSEMMQVELTQFLGREPYERTDDDANHLNGAYYRQFTLKGIGTVGVEVPRDRKGDFQTQVNGTVVNQHTSFFIIFLREKTNPLTLL